MKKLRIGFSIGIAALVILLIFFLATGFWERFFYPQAEEDVRTRIVIPREAGSFYTVDSAGHIIWEENLNTKILLEDAHTIIAVLNRESDEDFAEEQFVIFRRYGAESQLFITFLGYDIRTGAYRRMWDAPIAATQSETITIFSQDLIGDRNNCIIVTGMNAKNEHTMTIFRRSFGRSLEQPFNKIAEIQIDGSIIIQETLRSLAYQHGHSRGQSFNIAAYGHDSASDNILDQIEIIYSFNPLRDQFEQSGITRIPGSQVEQRRLREILSGTPGVFENFINDLWFYVTPQGTIDNSRFLYFDPAGREIIFFSEGSQQVYRWQSSTPTRFGLHIRSQNISISTLLRFIDIELESLDRIRLRVVEDIRIKITANTTWDGSYRRAGAANIRDAVSLLTPAVDAVYDSSWGRIQFQNTGEYSINSGGIIRGGHYVFFRVDDSDLIEFRPSENNDNRLVYRIESVAGVKILSRVRIGITGVQDTLEPPVTLTPVE
jgi:hypothetical protein